MIGGRACRNLEGTLLGVVGFTLVLTTLALTFATSAGRADERSKINIGLQLYSLRDQLGKDVPGPLARVQEWGIHDVEAAGFYKLSAKEFRDELDKHQLHASGAHFPWERFDKDMEGVVRDAKTLGCTYVTLPWIPHQGLFSLQNARIAIQKFNHWGRQCADAGLHFTYHPHGYEFRPYQGTTLFDIMAQGTQGQYVNFELDIFWAHDGGADPVQLMQKYPTRFVQMHLKDMKKSVKRPNFTGHEPVEDDVALGTGQLDLPAILKEAARVGVKHYYIEDESKESVERIPQSMQYLRSIGF
jgi:sugar phosphate isomerase/epimerase